MIFQLKLWLAVQDLFSSIYIQYFTTQVITKSCNSATEVHCHREYKQLLFYKFGNGNIFSVFPNAIKGRKLQQGQNINKIINVERQNPPREGAFTHPALTFRETSGSPCVQHFTLHTEEFTRRITFFMNKVYHCALVCCVSKLSILIFFR